MAEAAARKLGLGTESGQGSAGSDGMPSTDELSDLVSGFHFPDDLWARVFYDLLVSASFGDVPTERLVAAFVPIYFGRVGSLVIEARRLSDEQAEERVERQAREFEQLKPYLVEALAGGGRKPAPGQDAFGGRRQGSGRRSRKQRRGADGSSR